MENPGFGFCVVFFVVLVFFCFSFLFSHSSLIMKTYLLPDIFSVL